MRKTIVKLVLLPAMLITCLAANAQDLIPEQNNKGKWGYVDQNGNIVIDYKYELAGLFEDGTARVRDGGQFSLIDKTGKFVSGKYTVMQPYAGTDNYLVSTGGALIDVDEDEVIRTRRCVDVERFGGTMVIPVKNAKWGIIDRTGREIIKPTLEEISNPRDGLIYIIGNGGKWGLLNDLYGIVIKPTYTFMGSFNNLGVCWVYSGGKLDDNWGRHPLCVTGGKMSIIDKTGKLLIPLQFECVSTFENYHSDLYSSKRAGGQYLRPFEPLPDSDEDVLWYVTKGTKYFRPGLINSSGEILMPEGEYHTVYKPTEGMALVSAPDDRITRFFDIENKKEVSGEPGFTYSYFKDGSSVASKEDGSVNYLVGRDMKEISQRYTHMGAKSGEYIVVARGGKYGVIDRKGGLVIDLQYLHAADTIYDGTLCCVLKAGSWGVVDMNNNAKIPFEYTSLNHRKEYYVAKKDNKVGILSFDNKIILPIEWPGYIYPEKFPPEYVWVDKEESSNSYSYYYYDIATQQVLFPGEHESGYNYVELFRDRKFARVGRFREFWDPANSEFKTAEFYGAVRKDGLVVVDLQYKNLADVDRALFYLEKNGLDEFKEVDRMRFEIQLRGTCNSYSIESTIPQKDWDY